MSLQIQKFKGSYQVSSSVDGNIEPVPLVGKLGKDWPLRPIGEGDQELKERLVPEELT
jgi:hypothetical protein